jgi:hypothetical protein
MARFMLAAVAFMLAPPLYTMLPAQSLPMPSSRQGATRFPRCAGHSQGHEGQAPRARGLTHQTITLGVIPRQVTAGGKP